jgi:RNA polymerase sigma-70 factor (ECF subfamily)
METPDPDRELVERAQQELPKRTSAYNQLVRRHASNIFRRSYRILRSEADAEEATQEVLLAVYRSVPSFRFERPFSSWLSVVTLNACRMILRRRAQEQRRREAVANESSPETGHVEPDPALREIVIELLDQLDPGTRIPLLLRFVEGFTYAEIAEQLELGESAVKMRVSRGAQKLRDLYEKRVGKTESYSEVRESHDD